MSHRWLRTAQEPRPRHVIPNPFRLESLPRRRHAGGGWGPEAEVLDGKVLRACPAKDELELLSAARR